MNVGAPAGGVNAAMRSVTRIAITKGYRVMGILEGFQGLVNGEVRDILWDDVRGWISKGGSNLGTRRCGNDLFLILGCSHLIILR